MPKRSTYIVYMDKSLMPKAYTSPYYWYSSIIDSFKFTNHESPYSNLSSSPSLLYTCDNALHGFSVFISLDELEILNKSLGFISACADKPYKLTTTSSPEFLSLKSSTGLWPASNYGKDVIIGFIDSGIWPEHPSFKDDGLIAYKNSSKWKGMCEGGKQFNSSMCNSKLIGVRYFNAGLKRGARFLPFEESARDTTGHGTLVSSIAAGNYVNGASYFGHAEGTAKGVAPYAKIAVYKVVWGVDERSTTSDIIAGMDKAIADAVDVICISMAPTGHERVQLSNDPLAKASFSAINKGITVTTVIGNEGPNLATLKNGIPWVLTVTSGNIDQWFGATLTMSGLNITGWATFTGKAMLENLPLVYNETLSRCNSQYLLYEVPSDTILLCDIGNLDLQVKSIVTSHITGAILISNGPPNLSFREDFRCPCLVVRSTDARELLSYARNSDKPLVSKEFRQTFMNSKPAPVVPPFASRGPSLDFPWILKPDAMAPGELILAASVPNDAATKMGSFELVSGTSFACPHAAGVVALLKGAHPEWSPAAIKSAIITTANTVDNTLKPIQEMSVEIGISSPIDMGVGQIDPNKALDPGLIYDLTPQDYINRLCSLLQKHEIELIIRSGNYDCSNPLSDLNYPSFISFYQNSRMRPEKFKRTVTNVGKGATIYKALVTTPENYDITISPMTLVFSKKYEKQSYTVTIIYKGNDHPKLTFGELEWVEENGDHNVRSPIMLHPATVF
ncbi:subtilisin-like protease SBT3 [Fagus crenata]